MSLSQLINQQESQIQSVSSGQEWLRTSRPFAQFNAVQYKRRATRRQSMAASFFEHIDDDAEEVADPENNFVLLVVNPQNDFHAGGAVPVSSPATDAENTAAMLSGHAHRFHKVVVALTSHQHLHISHASFWRNGQGMNPPVDTVITAEAVRDSEWRPVRESAYNRVHSYLRSLDYASTSQFAEGQEHRYHLKVLPEHCVLGTSGHNITAPIAQALRVWSVGQGRAVQYVHTGEDPFDAAPSVLRPESEGTAVREALRTTAWPLPPPFRWWDATSVPDMLWSWVGHVGSSLKNCKVAGALAAGVNVRLLQELLSAERVLVCGQSLSGEVNFTVRDLLHIWPKDQRARIVVLHDACSPVAGHEAEAKRFLQFVAKAGATVLSVNQLDTLSASTLNVPRGLSYHTALLIINPQADFFPGGVIPISGADMDCDKIVSLIVDNIPRISSITVALTAHQYFHISSPGFWADHNGINPEPLTTITSQDIIQGRWKPTKKSFAADALRIVSDLEEQAAALGSKRAGLTVWNNHCVMGTQGCNVYEPISSALHRYAKECSACIEYVHMETDILDVFPSVSRANPLATTHVGTPVEESGSRASYGQQLLSMNFNLMCKLISAERILVCGETLTHGVCGCLVDLAGAFPDAARGKIHFLEDVSSPMFGFEPDVPGTLEHIKALGVACKKSYEAFII